MSISSESTFQSAQNSYLLYESDPPNNPPFKEPAASPVSEAMWQDEEDWELGSFELKEPHPYNGTRVRIICELHLSYIHHLLLAPSDKIYR